MNLKEFTKEFEEILMVESGTINQDTLLSELEDWDSLTKVALEVVVEENFDLKLSFETINKFETFSDIVDVLEGKLSS